MGAAGRALVSLAILAMTACGTTVQSIKSGGDFVPWRPLPASHQQLDPPAAPKPASVPADAPACVASQLAGTGLAGSAATGNSDLPLLFRNTGSTGCYLRGFADITILDRAGRVLARSVGEVGRGTFFADAPVGDVWMPAGTPAMPSAFTTHDGFPGQAYMNMSWYDCGRPLAAAIEVGLPGAGGTLRMRYVIQSSTSPACEGAASPYGGLFRGPLSAAGFMWPYADVTVELSAPAVAKRGSPITYFATVTNSGYHSLDLRPCPDYWESIHGKQFQSTYQLNCTSVAPLAPGASVTFEMRYKISAETDPGASEVCWFLADARLAAGGGSCAPVRIS